MAQAYEAAKHISHLHGRGIGVIVAAISVVTLLLVVAVAINYHSLADRMPWAGRSSDPERQALVVSWNRVGCGVFAIIALLSLVAGIRLIAAG